nr:gamma-glutamylcyclotransferase family protein [Planococcus glaciei]
MICIWNIETRRQVPRLFGRSSIGSRVRSSKGDLYDTGLGYPAMDINGKGEVQGEIYDIPEALWPAIDYLEDYSGGAATDLFNKVKIEVKADGKVLQTVVYVATMKEQLKEKSRERQLGCISS